MASPQAKAATKLSNEQARLSEMLWNLAGPKMDSYVGGLLVDFNADGTSRSVSAAYDNARAQAGQEFGQQKNVQSELVKQQARQSGEVFGPAVVQSSIDQGQYQLAQDYQSALRNLQFQESQAQLQQFNATTGMLGQAGNQFIGLGAQFTGNRAGAIAGMPNQSPWAAAAGGAATGASVGSVGGVYGALAGAILGGAAGYYSAG